MKTEEILEQIWDDMPEFEIEGHDIMTKEEAFELAKRYHASQLESGIKAKALRKRGTDKWYCQDMSEDDRWFTLKLPQLMRHEVNNSTVINSLKNFGLPADAELVDIVIIVKS